MEKSFYRDDVEFIDPLNSFRGVEKYQGNVDMLAGRNALGSLLFRDAAIQLHNVEELADGRIQTRWTLRVTVKVLPWAPTPRFSGVSIYTLDQEGKIAKQEDFWDSINLGSGGSYEKKSFGDGLSDFLAQLENEVGPLEVVADSFPPIIYIYSPTKIQSSLLQTVMSIPAPPPLIFLHRYVKYIDYVNFMNYIKYIDYMGYVNPLYVYDCAGRGRTGCS